MNFLTRKGAARARNMRVMVFSYLDEITRFNWSDRISGSSTVAVRHVRSSLVASSICKLWRTPAGTRLFYAWSTRRRAGELTR